MDKPVQAHVVSEVVHGGPYDERVKIALGQVRGRPSSTPSLNGDLAVPQPAQSLDNCPKRDVDNAMQPVVLCAKDD